MSPWSPLPKGEPIDQSPTVALSLKYICPSSIARKLKPIGLLSYRLLFAIRPVAFTWNASPFSPLSPLGITKVNLLVRGLYVTLAAVPGTPVIVVPTPTFLISLFLAVAIVAAFVASNALFVAIIALSSANNISSILGTIVSATKSIFGLAAATVFTLTILSDTVITLSMFEPVLLILLSTPNCKSDATTPIVLLPCKSCPIDCI